MTTQLHRPAIELHRSAIELHPHAKITALWLCTNTLGVRAKNLEPRSDCLECQAIVNKKVVVETLTQLRIAALDSAVSGKGYKACGYVV